MPYIWFGVVAILWVAFGAALATSTGSLDDLWGWVRGQSVMVQGGMWLLLFPWMAALLVWESTWVVSLKLVVIGGIVVASLFTFLPRASS